MRLVGEPRRSGRFLIPISRFLEDPGTRMISWLCFEWRADGASVGAPSIAPVVVRAAGKPDEEGVSKVLKNVFAENAGWGEVSRKLVDLLKGNIEEAFSTDEPSCLVAFHGTRIIGASLLDLDADASNHLLSGPCVLHEYRNRGVATALLGASLTHLRTAGVKTARGLTIENSITARFIYPKFSGASRPHNGDPLKLQAA